MYVITYQNASTKPIVCGEMEILEITQRQHNTHTKAVLRDKFVKSYWFGCADFAGGQSSFCLRYAKKLGVACDSSPKPRPGGAGAVRIDR